jgi:hypothetical protein
MIPTSMPATTGFFCQKLSSTLGFKPQQTIASAARTIYEKTAVRGDSESGPAHLL